jgi:hypothetical protein
VVRYEGHVAQDLSSRGITLWEIIGGLARTPEVVGSQSASGSSLPWTCVSGS